LCEELNGKTVRSRAFAYRHSFGCCLELGARIGLREALLSSLEEFLWNQIDQVCIAIS
jgi:hypothetical protein